MRDAARLIAGSGDWMGFFRHSLLPGSKTQKGLKIYRYKPDLGRDDSGWMPDNERLVAESIRYALMEMPEAKREVEKAVSVEDGMVMVDRLELMNMIIASLSFYRNTDISRRLRHHREKMEFLGLCGNTYEKRRASLKCDVRPKITYKKCTTSFPNLCSVVDLLPACCIIHNIRNFTIYVTCLCNI